MKKKLIYSFMLVCIALFVYQGVTLAGITGKIAGIITDAATGEPLPAVNVVIEGTTLGGATDNEGSYFVINIPPGTYTLQASMVGYTVESRTGIIVNVDHTTPVDFNLRVTAIAGEEVTVTAEREIVPMDISASHIIADAEQIAEVPMITDIAQYIHLQAGIEGDYIRGGGLDQTGFMVDGLMVVDNRMNKPMMMVNLSAVKELNIIKGGFNAEYGNVRSGLINVVTKEGSPSVYHGSFDFRYTPPHLKHSGSSIFSPESWFLRPYLDPAVSFVGTENGTWDAEAQEKYIYWMGWNEYSDKLLNDKDPTNNRTPQESQEYFIWRHLSSAYPEWDIPSCDELAPETWPEGYTGRKEREGKYGHRPDWNLDASFGGPVPLIGKYLGNLSFFASYRNNREMFGVFANQDRDYFKEENINFKVTSRMTQSMKLTIEGLYGEINSIATTHGLGPTTATTYFSSGDAILNSSWFSPGNNAIYMPCVLGDFDVYRSMVGLSFDHVLSPKTFYSFRINHSRIKNESPACFAGGTWNQTRNREIVRYFGNTPVDEAPYGTWYETGYEMMLGGPGGGLYITGRYPRTEEHSEVNTLQIKFDMTSQVDRYNMIKGGFLFNYDDIDNYTYCHDYVTLANEGDTIWRHFPYRIGAYLQDKLEFEGMIANFGLRLDYNEPNCDWYSAERYSKYFSMNYRRTFREFLPTEPAKGHVKISPRIGVSHPISENAKLYFNYGHFYSMPGSSSMYRIHTNAHQGIDYMGNPSADLPKTVSYELGVEYNVRNLFLIHLAGYYKDVSDQTASVRYTSYDYSVNYQTTENKDYADIRGFELRLDKRFGRWITGWINYNYMVTTAGYVGRYQYYQDPRLQRIYGLENPKQERPIARPLARANINLRTPANWGPKVSAINPFGDLSVSFLFSWRAGRYTTWDPLETAQLQNNVQWKDYYNFDSRFSKITRLGKYRVTLFVDVKNLFNIKRLSTLGFMNSEDQDTYYKSLHLPMYGGTAGAAEQDYRDEGLIPGNDKMGDVKSEDKPYINMPNVDEFMYFDLRTIFFGIKVDF